MGAALHLVKQHDNVFPLEKRRRQDTITQLEILLDQARNGQIHGFMFMVQLDTGEDAPGITGEYRSKPTIALGVAAKLWQALHVLAV